MRRIVAGIIILFKETRGSRRAVYYGPSAMTYIIGIRCSRNPPSLDIYFASLLPPVLNDRGVGAVLGPVRWPIP